MRALLAVNPITKQAIAQEKERFIQSVTSIGKDPVDVHEPRDIAYRYRREDVKTKSTSILDEWNVRVDAMKKTIGVETEVLPNIFCEKDLAPKDVSYPGATVAADAVADSKLARNACM
eukprot:6400989-Pyramimonas_sp.AAC.1